MLGGVSSAAPSRPHSNLALESSDAKLVESFNWARTQALAYAFTGDPVGDWYEASLPGRSAFCMRDVSHQAMGAQVLGLADSTRNMLRRFAENVSDSKDWCTYWEIDKWNRPAPVDYKNDKDFWYNLPANFDILNCCWRMFLWTANETYINDPVFLNFYDRTVHDYVKRWDKDGDGIPESRREYGHRGIGSYDEDLQVHVKVGSDLIAAQIAAYRAYAAIQHVRGNAAQAASFNAKAGRLATHYNRKWWDPANQCYYKAMLQDGTLRSSPNGAISELWFDVAEPGVKTQRALDLLKGENIEVLSYFPEIAYRYGRDESAYRMLLRLTDPNTKRRDYPEVSFAMIGAIAEGMMGLRPDARSRTIESTSHLTPATEWAALKNVPVFDNEITLRHTALTATSLTNQTGGPIHWKACIPGKHRVLLVNGRQQPADAGTMPGGAPESHLLLRLGPGETANVQIP